MQNAEKLLNNASNSMATITIYNKRIFKLSYKKRYNSYSLYTGFVNFIYYYFNSSRCK